MDPDLERYLNERGLPEHCLDLAGVDYQKGVLRFPRRSLDNGELLGWKCRNLDNGRFWGDPGGIPHSRARPFMVEGQVSATGAMICEGESDTMRLACTDLPGLYNSDVICIPGATAFPNEWVPLLRRYDRVHVFADADEAGRSLPNRLARLVPGVRCVRLPEGHDICSFLNGVGTEDDLTKLFLIAPLHIAPAGSIRKSDWIWDDAGSAEHRDKLTRIVSTDVRLQRRGSELVGLCPFHEENTPSFSVNPVKGLYRCFGCGVAGDVISYLKDKRDMSFGEAMRYLEDYR